MTLHERFRGFRRKWLGKSIGKWSTSKYPQCVDLCRQWMFDGWRFTEGQMWRAIPRSNAEDWFALANRNLLKKTRYQPGGVAPEGAIVVLRHGEFGHVFIAKKDCTKTLMRSLDQNWSVRGKITDEAHRYYECIGWLTPR